MGECCLIEVGELFLYLPPYLRSYWLLVNVVERLVVVVLVVLLLSVQVVVVLVLLVFVVEVSPGLVDDVL
jgi:hypothetical protein